MTTTSVKMGLSYSTVEEAAIDYVYNADMTEAQKSNFASTVSMAVDIQLRKAGYRYYDDRTGEAVYNVGTDPEEVDFEEVVSIAIEVADKVSDFKSMKTILVEDEDKFEAASSISQNYTETYTLKGEYRDIDEFYLMVTSDPDTDECYATISFLGEFLCDGYYDVATVQKKFRI